MSKGKDPEYVTEEVCAARFGALSRKMEDLKKRSEKVVEVLIGPDMKSGIVGDLAILKKNSQSSLSGKDKAAVVSSVIIAIAGILVALIK